MTNLRSGTEGLAYYAFTGSEKVIVANDEGAEVAHCPILSIPEIYMFF